MSQGDREAARITQEVAARAIRRLDLVEWLLLFVAATLALIGGALVAFVFAPVVGLGFRPMWMVASLALFVVPGAIAKARLRRDERDARSSTPIEKEPIDG